jgi:hypothetical protein
MQMTYREVPNPSTKCITDSKSINPGLRILARMIARSYLRRNWKELIEEDSAGDSPDSHEQEDGNKGGCLK